MFNNTSQPVIQGGQFTNVLQGDAHFHVEDTKGSINRGLDFLHWQVITGAFYDAAERGNPPKCHPHTRLTILAEIQKWVRDPEVRNTFIIWLYGPAGSGKSAIAETIAEILAKEQLLVASFFFSRTGIGRNDTKQFIASIAYQLSLSIPNIRAHIARAVEQDPLIFSRTLSSQMQVLIIQPLNAAAVPSNAIKPRLVVIDGLDEVNEETKQKELLEALVASTQQLHIPLIFLVASRPETVIRQTFNKSPLQSLMEGLALDEQYKPDDDICIFLRAEFEEIRKSHPSGNTLPVLWPSQEDIDYLIQKGSGQFIYASTVMKYIKSPRDNPIKKLKIILGLSHPGNDTPFTQLDALYTHILSSVKYISRVLEILALVFLQPGYSFYLSTGFMERFLEYDYGDVAIALTDMHALVHVPLSGAYDDTLRIYHAYLQDFLMDRSRSGHFFLDATMRYADLARHHLRYVTTAPKSEDKDRIQILLTGFIDCYLKAHHTDELVAELETFSLTNLLSNRPLELFYRQGWNSFFKHLRNECNKNNAGLYKRLRDEFDTWIYNRYKQYPVFIQNFMSTAYAIPGQYLNTRLYIPDIFDIVMHNLPAADAIRLRELDMKLFRFQEAPSIVHIDENGYTTLQNFFINHSRIKAQFGDELKLANLAEEIVKAFCQRGEELPSTLTLRYKSLDFFPKILNAASQDPKLAQLMWEIAVQYKTDRGEIIANACLDYIKRCGIYIPEHVHQADCTVCANYKPTFTIRSDASSTVPYATSTSYSRPTKASSSTIHHLPNFLSKLPFLPLVIRGANSERRSSADVPVSTSKEESEPSLCGDIATSADILIQQHPSTTKRNLKKRTSKILWLFRK